MPDTRKNPYAPRRNPAGRTPDAVTDPPKYIRDRKVPADKLKRMVVTQGRWTPETMKAWRRAWRLTQREWANAMGVARESLARVEEGRVPVSRTWAKLFDAECPRIEDEILAIMRAHRARKLVGSPKLDEQFKPRRFTAATKFLPGKIVPRDANGVPIRTGG